MSADLVMINVEIPYTWVFIIVLISAIDNGKPRLEGGKDICNYSTNFVFRHKQRHAMHKITFVTLALSEHISHPLLACIQRAVYEMVYT